MKKVIFLFFMVITCYVAGMYRSMSLLVFALLECFLFIAMFFMPYYLKRVLTVRFLSAVDSAQKGIAQTCKICVRNKGLIAAGQFQIRMKFGYRYSRKMSRIKLFGAAGGHGESELSFQVNTPYCGLMELELEKIKLYDYLSLFSAGKRQKSHMQLVILPQENPLFIEYYCPEWRKENPYQEDWIQTVGNEQREIRQLREYQQGDDIRRIHWKQSARMQELWIKEYEKETDSVTDFFLELAKDTVSVEEMDVFYEVVSSILLGLLRCVNRVRVHWFQKETDEEFCMEIKTLEEYKEVLLQLYQFDLMLADTDGEKQLFLKFREKGQEAFCLNRSLEWYYNENLITIFSEQELIQEEKQKIYVVQR